MEKRINEVVQDADFVGANVGAVDQSIPGCLRDGNKRIDMPGCSAKKRNIEPVLKPAAEFGAENPSMLVKYETEPREKKDLQQPAEYLRPKEMTVQNVYLVSPQPFPEGE